MPTGSGVKDNNKKTDLLYNEYIVYDVAQVVVEHLLLHGFESWLRIYSGSSEIPPADEVQLQDLNEPKAFFMVAPLSFFSKLAARMSYFRGTLANNIHHHVRLPV